MELHCCRSEFPLNLHYQFPSFPSHKTIKNRDEYSDSSTWIGRALVQCRIPRNTLHFLPYLHSIRKSKRVLLEWRSFLQTELNSSHSLLHLVTRPPERREEMNRIGRMNGLDSFTKLSAKKEKGSEETGMRIGWRGITWTLEWEVTIETLNLRIHLT